MIENLNCKKGVAIVLAGILVNVSANKQGKETRNGLTRNDPEITGRLLSGLKIDKIFQNNNLFANSLQGLGTNLGPGMVPRGGQKGKQCKKKSKSPKKCSKKKSKSPKKCSKSPKKCGKSPNCKPCPPPPCGPGSSGPGSSGPGSSGPGSSGKKNGPKTVINNIIVDSTVQNINSTTINNVNITAGGNINGDVNISQQGSLNQQTSTKNTTIENTLVASSKTGVKPTYSTKRY